MNVYAGIARAPFLVLPFALVVAGTGAAAAGGGTDLFLALIALVGLTAAHVAVNALNEWSDYRSGIDLKTSRTPFSGGSGTLPAGLLPPRAALALAAAAFAVALAVGIFLVTRVGWPLVPLIAIGAFSILAYTDCLARAFVGEAIAGLSLGALPVVGVALVQTGRIDTVAILASVPAFLMTFNLLLLNEFPDETADREGGRRNLVLLLGRPLAARVWAACALLVLGTICTGVGLGVFPALALVSVLPLAALGPAFRWALRDPAGAVPHPALAGNVAWNLATNILLGVALWVA